ncbi:hypothetical protein SeLEV6574_g07869 [Synchytrium endobioticum]|uniref:Uncharacterized protein n=1 Tax=Synchytrium endobioticum TaxID=286115 RepID=A0A507CDV7_9FUNG|nr:hypothetical protein SeLEV6574_g07869 [Synchytrium endobioticum]
MAQRTPRHWITMLSLVWLLTLAASSIAEPNVTHEVAVHRQFVKRMEPRSSEAPTPNIPATVETAPRGPQDVRTGPSRGGILVRRVVCLACGSVIYWGIKDGGILAMLVALAFTVLAHLVWPVVTSDEFVETLLDVYRDLPTGGHFQRFAALLQLCEELAGAMRLLLLRSEVRPRMDGQLDGARRANVLGESDTADTTNDGSETTQVPRTEQDVIGISAAGYGSWTPLEASRRSRGSYGSLVSSRMAGASHASPRYRSADSSSSHGSSSSTYRRMQTE